MSVYGVKTETERKRTKAVFCEMDTRMHSEMCVFVFFLLLFFSSHIYRGPSNNNYDSYDLKYNGQSHRPTPNLASSGYYNPYLSKHGFYGTINPKDRISIGGGKQFYRS